MVLLLIRNLVILVNLCLTKMFQGQICVLKMNGRSLCVSPLNYPLRSDTSFYIFCYMYISVLFSFLIELCASNVANLVTIIIYLSSLDVSR